MATAKWILAESEKPHPGDYVWAVVRHKNGRRQVLRAMWAAKYTLPADDESWARDDWADYDEDTDEFYAPEGWYEANQHEEVHWRIDTHGDVVTHWAPMPELPEESNEQE